MRAVSLLIVVPAVLAVNVDNPQNPDFGRATWGYLPSNGPATWPSTYESCAGTSQSPIDINTANVVMADPGQIKLGAYDSKMAGEITNNEHTITFTFKSGVAPYIYGGRLPAGDIYEFAQLHWHWGSVSTRGSEHTLDGKEFPCEVHLVHYNKKYGDIGTAVTKDDGLAVLGFFYEVSSADNGNLDAMLSVVNQVRRRQLAINRKNKNLRNRAGPNNRNATSRATNKVAMVPGTIRLDQLLPSTGLPEMYYYYKGGLTTPTCDEVVLWTVFAGSVPISEAQLNQFRTLTDSNGVTLNDNYRPPQALNGRIVSKRNPTTTTTTTTSNLGATSAASLSGAIFGSIATFFAFVFLYPNLEGEGSYGNQKRRSHDYYRSVDGFEHHTPPRQEAFGSGILKKIFGI